MAGSKRRQSPQSHWSLAEKSITYDDERWGRGSERQMIGNQIAPDSAIRVRYKLTGTDRQRHTQNRSERMYGQYGGIPRPPSSQAMIAPRPQRMQPDLPAEVSLRFEFVIPGTLTDIYTWFRWLRTWTTPSSSSSNSSRNTTQAASSFQQLIQTLFLLPRPRPSRHQGPS